MYKKFLFGLVGFGMLTILFTACAIRDASTVSGPAVHMGGASFIQTSITIKKGDPLTLIDDVASQHIIKNGMWVNGSAKSMSESGAPTVSLNVVNQGDTVSTPPFTTSGTFQLYCTIHGGMNLTVKVQ